MQYTLYVWLLFAGFVAGMCHSTELNVGGTYIVTLRDDERLTPDDHDMEAEKYLPEVIKACGLQPFTPNGEFFHIFTK